MTTVFDVPADTLIREVARILKEDYEEVTPPSWAPYVKTGSHKERAVADPDWWFVRCASILRKVYLTYPVGISRLRTAYGGKKRRGSRPEHFRKGSGAIIRNALGQLEAAGLVQKEEKKGRMLTPKGRSLLDLTAHKIHQALQKKNKK
ncbi:MAG: 30S ribosomal protein S19e [Promethearchaeota archaeon]